MGEGSYRRVMVGRRVVLGEVHASELFCPRMGCPGSDLGGQVVRECWGWEARQGVLIIGFRTSVGSSTGALASWICQSAVQTNSGIIHVLW